MKHKKYVFIPILVVALILSFILPSSASATESIVKLTFDHQPLTIVTDPAKMVKDEHTKATLEAQGINTNYVELVQDYGKKLTVSEKASKKANPFTANTPDPTPYARTYQDRVSGQYIAEIQQLPMVNAEGVKVNASWALNGKTFTAGANQFVASVNGNTTTLTVLNDQPTGVKSGATLTISPTVYLGGKIVSPKSVTPTLLAVDPVNENYTNNTLVWDYGICKRYLRLIEGSILGRWEFTSNPKGEVRIVYNQHGDFDLKLGQYATDSDTEVIPLKIFDSAEYPFEVGDSQTFYPDANPETNSVDGYVDRLFKDESWATIISSAGNNSHDLGAEGPVISIKSSTTDSQWSSLYRSIFLFDTSGLGGTAIVTGAVLSIRGSMKSDDLGIAPNLNIYTSTPASNTELAASDYQQLGSVAQSDAIAYADWNTGGYNNYILNDLTKIDTEGVSKFGARNANYDVSGTPPSWTSFVFSAIRGYFSELGDGYKPKLVVTYTVPAAPTITISAATFVTGVTARLNGNVTDTGGDDPTVTMYWGTTDGLQVSGDWDFNSGVDSPAQPQGVAAFYLDVASLTSSTTYYFSAAGTNNIGTDWADASLTFKTLSRIAKINGISLNDLHIIW